MFIYYQVINQRLEKKLKHILESWQETIDTEMAHLNSLFEFHEIRETAETNYKNLDNKIDKTLTELNLVENVPEIFFGHLREELNQFKVELKETFDSFCNQLNQQLVMFMLRHNETPDSPDLPDSPDSSEEDFDDSDDEQQQGLSLQSIQQFEQFIADESFVGDQCVICMGDIEIGRNMMRLDCDGQHTFCQVCIEGWFADHNTCPVCRHKF